MSTHIIKIENFKLNLFRKLLEQSLVTSNELIFEVTTDLIKSCSFSSTKSLIKLWTLPLNKIVKTPTEDQEDVGTIDGLFDETEIAFDFESFNFYILRGDLFKKYLSVYNADVVNIEFTIDEKHQGELIKINGMTESNYPLETTFILTKEKMLSNTIEDYSEIITACTPDKDMLEIMISAQEVKEIKRLIKNLHRSITNNTSYLTFTIDTVENKLIVKDNVFVVTFDLSEQQTKLPTDEIVSFNMLKTDFVMAGNHDFSIYVKNNSPKIIFGTNYINSIIWIMSSKVEDSVNNFSQSIDDAELDNIDFDVEEYLN